MEININVDDETKKNCKIVGQSRALKSTKEAPISAALFAKIATQLRCYNKRNSIRIHGDSYYHSEGIKESFISWKSIISS